MKMCGECSVSKSLDEFHFKSKQKGTRRSWCKECVREYNRGHYRANKKVYKKRARDFDRIRRVENLEKIARYLEGHPCVDCGEGDRVVLEFDHRDPEKKSFNIGSEVKNKPWSELREEIKKCDVRCANCHKRRTAKQQGWYQLVA